jgi:hypothetical protein
LLSIVIDSEVTKVVLDGGGLHREVGNLESQELSPHTGNGCEMLVFFILMFCFGLIGQTQVCSTSHSWSSPVENMQIVENSSE